MFRKMGALLPLVVLLAACGGGSDRAAAAQSVERQYWQAVGSAHFTQAYALLSDGQQSQVPLSAYRQSMFGFLQSTSGVSAKVGKPIILGDCALVPVALVAKQAPGGALKAAQHMYWVNGHWRITEPNGGLYQGKMKLTSCPTGT